MEPSTLPVSINGQGPTKCTVSADSSPINVQTLTASCRIEAGANRVTVHATGSTSPKNRSFAVH